VPTMRICSFNCEFMNDWFTSDAAAPAFRPTFTRDGHTSNTQQTAGRTAALIKAVDADILAIQEAPSRREEMALFIQTYLSDAGVARYQFFLGDSGGAQKLALLYKPGSVNSAQLAPHEEIAMLLDPWLSDVDGSGFLSEYRFTRQPLVVNLKLGGHDLQLIVAHTKSNFINQGKQMWDNPATHQNYIIEALKNRRRNSSEGMRLRKYIDAVLTNTPRADIVVLGDLNDGPGMDYFEENYLTHNVTDILTGSAFQPEWIFRHAQHDLPPDKRYSAIFDDFVTGENAKHLLLDHILLSPGLGSGGGLRKVANSGTVHHAEYDAQTVNQGLNREDRPSDHRPVSVQLQY
jgi:endonuclease/exonuclease/phosphatase family metal-dependent hydrolase